MKRLSWLAVFLVMTMASTTLWAQRPKERTGEVGMGTPPEKPTASGKVEGIKGKVLVVSRNDELLVKTEGGYLVVHYGQEFWNLGLLRGDEIAVWGDKTPNALFGNEVNAGKIELVSRPATRPEPVEIKSLAEVQGMRFADRIVITYGTIEEFSGSRVKLSSEGSSLWVELGTTDIREKFAYAGGAQVIVVGELILKPMDKELRAIVVRPFSSVKRPGEPEEAQDISAVLKERPLGKVVRVRGHIGMFVGDADVTLLYQDKFFLAVYRSEKYLSMDLPAGEPVEAVGTFEVMMYKDREVGVLREARIDLARMAKQVDRAKKSQ